MGLIYHIQRARLHRANLWSFQIVFLTIPFVLKTSWPHDFVFLPFTQALIAWELLERDKEASWTNTAGMQNQVNKRSHSSMIVTIFLLVPSIVFSNIVFFNLFSDFSRYGFFGFLFWANLLLLVVLYMQLLPPALRMVRQSADN
jgi:hypothetical protein